MSDQVNKALGDMVDNVEKEADEAVAKGTDEKHNTLVHDLEGLLMEAQDGKFHDFHSKGYPAPKMALVQKLDLLRSDVLDGKYDN